LKGHIDREAAIDTNGLFNGASYRHEIMTVDHDAISRKGGGYAGNGREDERYKPYRFETAPDDMGLAIGSKTDDIEDRVVPDPSLTIGCDQNGANGSPITTQHLVSSKEVWRCNFLYITAPNSGKYSQSTIDRFKRATPFTVQTSIASSYGYFQVSWVTAIDNGWIGALVNGVRKKNPRFLLDTPENTAPGVGGGTSDFAAFLVAKWLRGKSGPRFVRASVPDYSDANAFLDDFKAAWSQYNNNKYYPAQVACRAIAYQKGITPYANGCK